MTPVMVREVCEDNSPVGSTASALGFVRDTA